MGAQLPIEATTTLRLEGGQVKVAPKDPGADGILQQVFVAVYEAQITGTWRRLKLCRNPDCAVAFWDNSRNTSGVWHDVRTCGNVVNLRRSRARRATSTSGHEG